MDKRVKKIVFICWTIVVSAYANEVKCNIENQKIYCKYFVNRSDNANGKTVVFHWYSPSKKDDRERTFTIPPYYGSVYDYRYLPGREKGKWVVVVKDLDTNETSKTTFIIKNEDDDIFEE